MSTSPTEPDRSHDQRLRTFTVRERVQIWIARFAPAWWNAGMNTSARAANAVRAVVAVATAHGLSAVGASVIKDSNNTVVDLGSSPIVAKVSTTTLPGGGDDSFAREFAVLHHLHGSDAPVVRFSDQIPPGPHEIEGLRMLFLERVHLVDEQIGVADAVRTLERTHVALAEFEAPLPTFTDTLAAAHGLYRDQRLTPALPPEERRFCLAAGDRLLAEFADEAGPPMVLHGDPWRGGNLVATSAGPILLDFEAVCVGPLEWDLSAFGEEAAPFGDPWLFARCLAARSFLVAAVCWAQPGRAPDVDAAAVSHLHLLHQRTLR